MTRRGTLAYYLAGWVCGCFFMSFIIWLGNEVRPTVPRSVALLLYIYFLSLMFGALASLLFALLLRRGARSMNWSKCWHWLLGGAILAPALTALLGWAAASHSLQRASWGVWIFAPLFGPYIISSGQEWMPLLLTAPAGAATAWVLFRVHRAFAEPLQSDR